MEGVDTLFGNKEGIKAHHVFTMSCERSRKGLCITSLVRLDIWMKSYLAEMARKKNGLHRGGYETILLRNKSLYLLPVAMYNIGRELFDHMKRYTPSVPE